MQNIIENLPPFDWTNTTAFGSDVSTNRLVLKKMIDIGDGNKYEGQWDVELDAPSGRGIQVWADGSRYEGFWKHGKQNGYGRLIHNEGDVYEGMWQDEQA